MNARQFEDTFSTVILMSHRVGADMCIKYQNVPVRFTMQWSLPIP